MGGQCQAVTQPINSIFAFICHSSIINVMNAQQYQGLQAQGVIFFIAILANLFMVAYFQVQMQRKAKKMHNQGISASSYSFIVKGLPQNVTVGEIQKYVEDKLRDCGSPDLEIVRIYVIYDYRKYLQLLQMKQRLDDDAIWKEYKMERMEKKQLKMTKYQQKTKIKNQIQLMQKQLDKKRVLIGQLANKIQQFQVSAKQLTSSLRQAGTLQHSSFKFSGYCLITLNNPKSKQCLLSTNPQNCLQTFTHYLGQLLDSHQKIIVTTQAPQPNDIIFANLGSPKLMVWRKRIILSAMILLLLLVDFCVLGVVKKFVREENSIQKGNLIFSLVNSLMAALFCAVSRQIINISQRQSNYHTLSRQGYNSVIKMTLIFQLNMFFTTFLANVAFFYLLQQDKPTFQTFPLNFQHFLFDVAIIIATNPVISVVLYVFDHRQIRKVVRRWMVRRGWPVGQVEANIIFQDAEWDLNYKYSNIYRFIIFSAAIAVLFPAAFVICLLAITAFYFQDKYLLLRRYALKKKLTSQFSLLCQKILGQFPLYLSLMNLLVMFIPVQQGSGFQEYGYSNAYYILAIIAFSLSAFNYLIGNHWLKNIIKFVMGVQSSDHTASFPPYRDIQHILPCDYSLNYPYFKVTQQTPEQSQVQMSRKVSQLKEQEKLPLFQVLKTSISNKNYN